MDKKYILKVDADTSEADKKIEGVKENIGEASAEAKLAGSAVDKFGGTAVTSFKNAVVGAKVFAQSMTTLKGAIIATGIGALLIGVVGVIQAIQRLQSVTDKYSQVVAGATAVVNVLLDTWAKFVMFYIENVIRIFTDTQGVLDDLSDGFAGVWNWLTQIATFVKESFILNFLNLKKAILDTAIATKEFFGVDATELRAELAATEKEILNTKEALREAAGEIAQPFIDAANAVSEFVGELTEAAKKAAALEAVEQKLLDTQIKQTVAQAARSKQIAAARLLAEDETKSYEEREVALKKALELEQQNLDERLANARVEASLISQRNALSESTRDDLRREAEAKARVFELEESSLRQQKRIFTELQGLQKQRIAANEARIKEEEEAYKAYSEALDEIQAQIFESTMSAEARELQAAEDKYNKLLDLAETFNIETTELEEARNAEIQAIQDRYRAAEKAADDKAAADKKALDKSVRDSQVSMATDALNVITEITQMFAKGEGQRARRSFMIGKAAAIAQATANTALAVTDALAKDATFPGSRFIAAATTGTAGLAQILKIKQTQFGGGGGGGNVNVTPPTQQQTAPQVNFDFLNRGADQQSIKAYVLPSNVNNSLQANQKLNEQAAL